jgi:hypothetical protein
MQLVDEAINEHLADEHAAPADVDLADLVLQTPDGARIARADGLRLVLDGESYRQRQKPTVTNPTDDALDPTTPARRSSRRRR